MAPKNVQMQLGAEESMEMDEEEQRQDGETVGGNGRGSQQMKTTHVDRAEETK